MNKLELDSLTPEQKRIRIAEACGFADVRRRGWSGIKADCLTRCLIPDYLNDLNAMHEAESIWKDNLTMQVEWFRNIQTVLQIPANKYNAFNFCHATALQRADAFLLTI